MAAHEQREMVPSQAAQVTRRAQDAESRSEAFLPTVDISETSEALILRYDMPGVKKDNVDITVDKGTLSVTGRAEPEESGTPVYRETRIGDYRREFALPQDADPSRISAEMEAGVLTVRIGKPDKAKPKRIPITG